MLLSDTFIDKYKQIDPFPVNGLGYFVYLRTYSRWLPEETRREHWYETVRRVVEESYTFYSGHRTEEQLRRDAEELYDSVFNFKQFPSGRSLWVAGTGVSQKYGEANFNCAFTVIDNLNAYADLFFLLMVGTGVGFRVLPDDVAKLPAIVRNLEVIHKDYEPVPKAERKEESMSIQDITNLRGYFSGQDDQCLNSYTITVGDSKEGLVDTLRKVLEAITSTDTPYVKITINYDSVRPAGERLKTFGGRASGHEALKVILSKIVRVAKNAENNRLGTVDALDIANIIAEGVVCGGVRRSAQIALGDPNDIKFIRAKEKYYDDPNTLHRSLSNNTLYFTERPTIEHLKEIISSIKINGEPGFLNAEAASRRRPWFNGINPCAEILLDDKGLCNLGTVNIRAHLTKYQSIDLLELEMSFRRATQVCMRMTNIDLHLPEWDKIQKRDRLIGPSLTGWMDTMDAVGRNSNDRLLCYDHEIKHWTKPQLLTFMNKVVDSESLRYAKEMRIPAPLLTTCVKPEGSLSQLPTVSSGIHRTWSKYFIRRVRIHAADPLAQTMLQSGFTVLPENGEWKDGPSNPLYAEDAFRALAEEDKLVALEQAITWVVEFPVESDATMYASDESAKIQLKRYFEFQEYYTDHNTSITVYVGDDEWDEVAEIIHRKWDDYIAVSFLPKPNKKRIYALAPYESISKAQYIDRVASTTPLRRELLDEIELAEWEGELLAEGCETGVCPIR